MSDPRLRAALIAALGSLNATCERIGVSYFLIAGSLLGAVRDGGPIPWDDDLDVAMTATDLSTLYRHRDQLPHGLTMHTREDDPILGADAKVYIDGTRAVDEFGRRHGLREPQHPGLYIDIFVAYPVAERRHRAEVERLVATVAYARPWAPQMARSPRAARRWRWAAISFLPASFGRAARRWLTRSALRRRGSQIGIGLGAANGPATYPTDKIYPLGRRDFAGISAPVPRDPDAVLSATYGEGYLTPPPISERRSHFLSVTFD